MIKNTADKTAQSFALLREQIIQQTILAIDYPLGEDELITAIAGWGGVMTDTEVLRRLIAYNTKKLMPDLKTYLQRIKRIMDNKAANILK